MGYYFLDIQYFTMWNDTQLRLDQDRNKILLKLLNCFYNSMCPLVRPSLTFSILASTAIKQQNLWIKDVFQYFDRTFYLISFCLKHSLFILKNLVCHKTYNVYYDWHLLISKIISFMSCPYRHKSYLSMFFVCCCLYFCLFVCLSIFSLYLSLFMDSLLFYPKGGSRFTSNSCSSIPSSGSRSPGSACCPWQRQSRGSSRSSTGLIFFRTGKQLVPTSGWTEII